MQTAGETNRSRWDEARAGLLVLIGVIVAVAIVSVAVAVLSSAKRANEVSANNQQLLIKGAIGDHAERVWHHLESVAGTPRAVSRIHDNFDVNWVDHRVGQWLEHFFNSDAVAVFGANDQVVYARSKSPGEVASADLPRELASTLDLLRGRLSRLPPNTVAVGAPADLTKPSRSAIVIQPFLDKPAIVAAIAVGNDTDVTAGNVPIVLSIKYINSRFLGRVGSHLQIEGLRIADRSAPASQNGVVDLTDRDGNSVVRLTWRPAQPGGAIAAGVLPFIALAIVAFVLLIAVVMRYMRRTAAAIAVSERQLRELALRDPLCGLPNRIYFAERLERAIAEVPRRRPDCRCVLH